MRKRTFHALSVALVALLLASGAWAQPKLDVKMTAEKMITVDENGKKIQKRVEAKDSLPGDVLYYTVKYNNSGTSAAKAVNVDGLIPDGSRYVTDSASKPELVTFSIDNGKTFKKASLLTYETTNASGKKQQVKASPESYNRIRWVISEIPAGGSGELTYQVRVK